MPVGIVEFRTDGQSCFKPFGFSDFIDNSGYRISGTISLHNRDELATSLGLRRLPDPAGDLELALLAWRSWGCDAPTHLLGNFAFAIWDCGTNTLFCCRDHLGAVPFFYWQSDGRFVFATDLRELLGVSGVPRKLNRRRLAALIERSPHILSDESFHEGIYALGPGQSITADRSRISTAEYWQPAIREDLVPRGEKDAIAALRGLIFDAVDCRIRDTAVATSDLSGGLDSSALVSVAARCLATRNRQLKVFAAILPAGNEALGDERKYIDEFRSWPNIRIEYVTAEGRGPFDVLDEPGPLEVSPLLTSRGYLLRALEESATAEGTTAHMKGLGGEMGLTSWSHRFFGEMTARFHWVTALRELESLVRLTKKRAAGILKRQIYSPSPQPMSPFLYRTSLGGLPVAPNSFNGHPIDDRHDQLARLRNWMNRHFPPRNISFLPGFPMIFPLLDRRLLEFCISAPTRMKFQHGYNRNLVRVALDGVLPPSIQWRMTKTAFSPDYYVRFAAQRAKALHYVNAIKRSDPVREIVAIDLLRDRIQTADPQTAREECRDWIPEALYLISFLRQFEEFRN